MNLLRYVRFLCLTCLWGVGEVCFAHSGRLDAQGGHVGKDGVYHFHRPVYATNTVTHTVDIHSAPTNQTGQALSTETNTPGHVAGFAAPETYPWEYVQVDLPAGSRESLFQEVYAKMVGGRRERRIKTGRIDVETETEVFELDRQEKWKEGMGQALAYAKETGKKPVLVLISSSQGPQNMHQKSRKKFDLALEICTANKVRLVILFPNQPRAVPKAKQKKSTKEDALP
jgi:hypothetical protein